MDNFDRWSEEEKSHMEEMRKYLIARIAERNLNYKPTMIERIICYIKFNQLMKGLK